MKTLRYWLRFTKAFLSRYKGVLFFGLIIGLLLFVAFQFVVPFLNRDHQIIGLTGRHRKEDLPNEILSLISSGLTTVNSNGEAEPALANDWDNGGDGKTWTFTLKKNQTWQDNTAVTSDDFNFTFSDVQIEKPNPNTLIFKLEDPFSPFPNVLSKPLFKRGLLGTDEWKVSNLKLTAGFVDKITLKNSNSQKITYKFYPNENRTKQGFKLGEVDSITNILNPDPFKSWPTTIVESNPNNNLYVAIFFNNQNESLGGPGNKSLRQALSYAINKESLSSTRALGPISPNSWAYNPQVKAYSFDQNRAKTLLNDLSDEQLNNLNIKLTTAPVLLPIAEKVKTFWENVGIKSHIHSVSIKPDDFEAHLAIYNIPSDPDQYSTWHSTQQDTNIANYNSPRIDKLLEDGRLELDPDNRKKIYLDFQRFLLEDAPAIFLYHPQNYTITRK